MKFILTVEKEMDAKHAQAVSGCDFEVRISSGFLGHIMFELYDGFIYFGRVANAI